MARPTNRVRVMVAAASGCWASAVSAVATARPSASAGPIVPKPVVSPAMTIDVTAMRVVLSMVSFQVGSGAGRRRGAVGAGAGGGRDVDRGQDAEDVGLHHAGEESQRGHH